MLPNETEITRYLKVFGKQFKALQPSFQCKITFPPVVSLGTIKNLGQLCVLCHRSSFGDSKMQDGKVSVDDRSAT